MDEEEKRKGLRRAYANATSAQLTFDMDAELDEEEAPTPQKPQALDEDPFVIEMSSEDFAERAVKRMGPSWRKVMMMAWPMSKGAIGNAMGRGTVPVAWVHVLRLLEVTPNRRLPEPWRTAIREYKGG